LGAWGGVGRPETNPIIFWGFKNSEHEGGGPTGVFDDLGQARWRPKPSKSRKRNIVTGVSRIGLWRNKIYTKAPEDKIVGGKNVGVDWPERSTGDYESSHNVIKVGGGRPT